MKKLLLILLYLPVLGFSQVYDINAYKYIVISQQGDQLDIGSIVSKEFKSYGVKSFMSGRSNMPADFMDCQALYCQLIYSPYETLSQNVKLKLSDCDGNLIAESDASCAICGFTVASELRKASKKAVRRLKKLKKYKYDATILEHKFPNVEVINETPLSINFNSEKSIRKYIDSLDKIGSYEGIYRYSALNSKISSQYKFLILKNDFTYNGYIIEANCVGCQRWKLGNIKFTMNEGAVDGLFDVTWKYPKGENRREEKFILTGEYNGGLLKSGSNFSLIKLYPKLNVKKQIKNKRGDWSGNGSGIIISKSGYIVTNHHVIEDADNIEVEFILNDEVKKFNAEIVQVDKTNDLAIIKIFDMNFDGLDDLPYNFKSRSSDVGTKVYAFGYPMALSLMGKEIKVTDGIISSKTGFDGNITTYQITAPIQGGNSGGPLFDDKGNFLGINSSGLRKDIADNVGYTIKSSYVMNLLDVLPKTIDLPSNTKLQSLPLTEQIKEISKFVVLVKVK